MEGTYVTAVDLEAKRKEVSFSSSEAESLDMWGKTSMEQRKQGRSKKGLKKRKALGFPVSVEH